MSGAQYKPREGGLAARSIEHLTAIGGGPITQSQLANALEAEEHSLYVSLRLPVEHGLLKREQRDGEAHYLLPSAEQQESFAAIPTIAELKTSTPTPAPAVSPAAIEFVDEPRNQLVRLAPPPHDDIEYRYAMWDDGHLEIRRGDEVVVDMPPDKSAEFFDYLVRNRIG